MNQSLLIIERLVLECLEKKPLSLILIVRQSGLDEMLVKAILFQLIQRGIVLKEKNNYSLDWDNSKSWSHVIKSEEGVKAELKELFSAFVNQAFLEEKKAHLKVKKIWLEPREQEELKRKFDDVDRFLLQISQQRKLRPVADQVSQRQVLFYGSSPYHSLIQDIMQTK